MLSLRFLGARTQRALNVALLATLALAPTAAVHAQQKVCFQTPTSVPNYGGMPRWPTGLNEVPTPSTDTTTPRALRTNGFVSDPRWSGAPLRGMYVDDALSPYNDYANYRVVVDQTDTPTELAVTVQMRTTAGNPTANDYVYFGLSNDPAGTPTAALNLFRASGVRVVMQTTGTARFAQVPVSAVSNYTLDNGTWHGFNGLPNWIVSNSLVIWYLSDPNEAALNGTKLAVQFKVNLANLTGLANNTARLMVGASNDFGPDPVTPSNTIGRLGYSTPDLAFCAPSCDSYLGASDNGVPPNPFLADPNRWFPVAAIGSDCEGINIAAQDISATHEFASDPTRNCNGRSNCISAHNGVKNTFTTSPNVPAAWREESPQRLLADGDVVANFMMSNWGTVARASEWKSLGSASSSLYDAMGALIPDENDLNDNPLILECNNALEGNVCSQPVTVDYASNGFHQCLLVSLTTSISAAPKVTFANASAYINTRFEKASLIDALAEINVRGLANLDPSNPNRDVYLQVVRTNMVPAGQTPMQLNVPALEATRRQVDRDFAKRTGGCSHALDQCTPLDGPSYAGCVSECGGAGGEDLECPYGRSPIVYAGGCICYPTDFNNLERCTYTTEPLNDGLDPNSSSLDGAQVLNAQYPTIEIFPFYDSGRTEMNGGVAKKKLVPMPSFGIHAWHEGDFYGWLTDIVDESGADVQEVYPDVFKISVPKSTGVRRIRVLVSAEEQPHYRPMWEIAGTSTVLGSGLGNVFLTGVTAALTPLDLSKSTMTLSQLLTEGTVERVTNLGGPVTLTRRPGATSLSATFTYSARNKPSITVTVITLPLIGQTIQVNVLGASVQKPAACPLWFGSSTLATAFTISDGTNPPLSVRGQDQWTCVPFQLINL